MRRIATAFGAVVLSLLFAGPAFAGGWAVTTLDQLPPDIRATQTYSIGYTIRQHGVTPINIEQMGGTTEIQITAPDGAKTLRYKGVQDGATGHYVAKVIFPYQGTWTWTATQGPFQPFGLGFVTVAPAVGADAPAQPVAPVAAAAAAPTPQPAGPNALLVISLLLGSAAGAVMLGSWLGGAAARAGRPATG